MLVTGTRGEQGEIVVPEMDTPENHRRLGEIRAVELERAMGVLGVTEWENLGYRDSDMMGRPGNLDPRTFWQADLDEAAGRLTWLVRRYQPDVDHDLQRVRRLRPSRPHPDPRRRGPRLRAGRRPRLVPGAARRGRRRRPGRRSKLYEQAIPASVRDGDDRASSRSSARQSSGSRPRTRRRSSSPSSRRSPAKMLVPDEPITTWVDISGDPVDRKWDAIHEHVTQISADSPFMLFGYDGWREFWGKEAYILRESRVATALPETDLFAGIV